MAKITKKKIEEALEVRKRIDKLKKELDTYHKMYPKALSHPAMLKEIREGNTRALTVIEGDLKKARRELLNLLGRDSDTLFDEYVVIKQQLEEILEEKQSRTEKLLLSKTKVVKEAVEKFKLTTDPRINIDIGATDAEKIEGILGDIHSAILRLGDNKHPKKWLTIEEMREVYSLGTETIEKIERTKLTRIDIGKGWKYSRDDMDAYLDELGRKK